MRVAAIQLPQSTGAARPLNTSVPSTAFHLAQRAIAAKQPSSAVFATRAALAGAEMCAPAEDPDSAIVIDNGSGAVKVGRSAVPQLSANGAI